MKTWISIVWPRVALLAVSWQTTSCAAPDIKLCFGMCDASAVVLLNEELFVAGNDEDNTLRVYSRHHGGPPIFAVHLSPFLGLKDASEELDIEGAARAGDRIYWITSHGRNKNGKVRTERRRFFATSIESREGNVHLQPLGFPYASLLRDLTRSPELEFLDLAQASRRAPKAEDALNIEGLVTTPEGHLLIGFRNPIPERRALIVPLLNPSEVIQGRPARLGAPLLIDLDGLGIRGMCRYKDRYLIIAGPDNGDARSRLYEWRGGEDRPRWIQGVDFSGLNPESLAPAPNAQGSQLLVLSDDGSVMCDGVECKELEDPAQRRFRSVHLPAPADFIN